MENGFNLHAPNCTLMVLMEAEIYEEIVKPNSSFASFEA